MQVSEELWYAAKSGLQFLFVDVQAPHAFLQLQPEQKRMVLDYERVNGYQHGQVVRGYNVNLSGVWFEIDGNNVHFTRKFSGARCTLTYFVCGEFLKATPEMRIALGSRGFEFVWSNPLLQSMATQKNPSISPKSSAGAPPAISALESLPTPVRALQKRKHAEPNTNSSASSASTATAKAPKGKVNLRHVHRTLAKKKAAGLAPKSKT